MALLCLLCGGAHPRRQSRAVPLAGLQALVRARCLATGAHSAALLALPADAVGPAGAPLCALCVGWRRRVQRLTGRARALTPFDHVLRAALAPGTGPGLDRRNWHRVVARAAAPGNRFGDLLPAPARGVLEAMARADPADDHARVLARAWFAQNGRPAFFPCAQVAQAVRRHLRGPG